MFYINGLNLCLKVEYSQWEVHTKDREEGEKLAFIPAFLSQDDCLGAAVSLLGKRSPIFLWQNVLHASFTIFLSRIWVSLPSSSPFGWKGRRGSEGG